ncbi:MAG TPA: class I SAM-dependent rRNA methyltransferase [Candidatus Limnocylindria bacterium]|nr:class I SAM-dependent rRNA methyltransferase [Candidatus Limnocylindria bacterium]
MSLSTVILKPGEADRVAAGHPWVYSNSILRFSVPATDGEVVQVKDHRQRLLGTGFYNSRSKIAVRILDRERVDVDTGFFRERLTAALALRKRWLPNATSFRLVNSESDFLSGLIVDKYEDVLVLQTSSLGMDKRKHLIAEVLQELLRPRAILERNDMSSRKFEGLAPVNDVLQGDAPASVSVNLNGLKFEADLAEGHKTGLYLDQQVNYQAIAPFAKGAEVLDCFSFLGGFALHAARAGAKHVHALDQSADAVAAATKNASENGLAGKVSFDVINVFDWLKGNTTVKPGERVTPRFDLIILDPPSFTRNRASVPDAMRGYKEIHLRAMKLLRPGGVLATYCCSHHVDTVLFENVILDAAFDAHRTLRRVAQYTQSPDHPIIPSIPETEYLKGFAYEMVK